MLGYAGLHVVLDEGYIDNVAVRPSCRRQGLRPAAGCVLPLWAGPPGLSDLGGPALQPGGGGPVLQAWLSGGGAAKGLLPRSQEDALLLTRTFVR